jgi:glycosyltransferase involved in cell wall biosynthesis
MRIGVDAACWANPRGYGRYTRALLKETIAQDRANEYVFFVDHETGRCTDIPDGVTRVEVDLSESPTRAATATGNRSIKDMWRIGRRVASEDLDILFYPSVYTYFPVLSPAKKIVTIYDVIPERFPELVFTTKKNKLFWDMKVKAAIRQADLILTISEFSKQGIMDVFGIDEGRIRLADAAVDDIFRPIDADDRAVTALRELGVDPDARFILYVGGIAPHKNLTTLVEAYAQLIREKKFADVRLVLTGDYEKDAFLIDHALMERLHGSALRDRVIFTGYTTDPDLVLLYNAATVFVLPSLIEGFGLPPLEAMACGTPVIVSNTASLPEVVGDAGLYFEPTDAGDLTRQLRRLLADEVLVERLKKRSIERAAGFSWKRSAEELINVFGEFKRDVRGS